MTESCSNFAESDICSEFSSHDHDLGVVCIAFLPTSSERSQILEDIYLKLTGGLRSSAPNGRQSTLLLDAE